MNPQDMHHWSGWPGAFCLKCGAGDPSEQALADGMWDFDLDVPPDDPLTWLGTPEQKAALDAAMVCPVKGTLEWSDELKAFVLKVVPQRIDFSITVTAGQPVAPQEPTSPPDLGPGTPEQAFDWQCPVCGATNPSTDTHCGCGGNADPWEVP